VLHIGTPRSAMLYVRMKLLYLLNCNQAVPVKLHLLARLRLNRLNSATCLTDPNLDYMDQKPSLPIINIAEDTGVPTVLTVQGLSHHVCF
jgi:hypothetical protein